MMGRLMIAANQFDVKENGGGGVLNLSSFTELYCELFPQLWKINRLKGENIFYTIGT